MSILRGVLQRLSFGEWLNDEDVNAFVDLVNAEAPQTFAFTSYFFTKLEKLRKDGTYSFEMMQRWAKKLGLRNRTNILVPINIEERHWLLVNVNMRTSTIEVIDSTSITEEAALDLVASVIQFLEDYSLAVPGAGTLGPSVTTTSE